MAQFNYTITAEAGLHARPAGLLVKEAAKFSSSITLAVGEKSIDAKKIFAVLGLGAKQNDEVTITATGDDQDTAIEALQTFFNENL